MSGFPHCTRGTSARFLKCQHNALMWSSLSLADVQQQMGALVLYTPTALSSLKLKSLPKLHVCSSEPLHAFMVWTDADKACQDSQYSQSVSSKRRNNFCPFNQTDTSVKEKPRWKKSSFCNSDYVPPQTLKEL